MAKGPRDYDSGTVRAIFRFARGTCYFPECSNPIMQVVDGRHLVAVEICHIRGANVGSARFDPSMDDEERAAFENLILLCTVHHKLVDRFDDPKYTVEELSRWKSDNEPDDLSRGLHNENSTSLEALLEGVLAALGPTRLIEVDLLAGALTSDGVMAVGFEQLSVLLEHNPQLRTSEIVAIAHVRNVGSMDVSLAAIDFFYSILAEGTSEPIVLSLLGRNDFHLLNPSLPHRLLTGEETTWLMKMDTIAMMTSQFDSEVLHFDEIYVRVRLGSGELEESPRVRISDIDGGGPV